MQRGRTRQPAHAGRRVLPLFLFLLVLIPMNTTDLVQGDKPIVAAPDLDTSQAESIEQWTHLVRRYYPNLATPIARALAQRAAQGPYGLAMQSIAQGLAQMNHATLGDMTGSELQMLSALLMHLHEEAQGLLVQVNAQWHSE